MKTFFSTLAHLRYSIYPPFQGNGDVPFSVSSAGREIPAVPGPPAFAEPALPPTPVRHCSLTHAIVMVFKLLSLCVSPWPEPRTGRFQISAAAAVGVKAKVGSLSIVACVCDPETVTLRRRTVSTPLLWHM